MAVGVIPNCGMTQLYCLSWSSTDWRDLACPPPIWPTATCMLPCFNKFFVFSSVSFCISIFQQFFVFFLTPLSSYSRWLRVTLSLLTADNTELLCNYWELFFLVGRRPHVATPCMSDKLAGALSVPHQCRSSYVSHPHLPLSCLINLQSKPKTYCQLWHNGQILSTLEHIRWQSAHPIILLLVHVDIASVNMYAKVLTLRLRRLSRRGGKGGGGGDGGGPGCGGWQGGGGGPRYKKEVIYNLNFRGPPGNHF